MRLAMLIGVCACSAGLAADPPYAGKWKMNDARSDFGDITVTYEQLPGGQIKATMDGQSYQFKMDGTEVMTPWGTGMTWKTAGAGSWQTTETTNGKVTSTGTVKLSGDGKMLAVDSRQIKADGGTSEFTLTLNRVSGGPGLPGKWKTKNLKNSSPEAMSVAPKGSDGLTLSFGNQGGVCDARFDGKDYPATGSLWPPGWTCSIARNGSHGFDLSWKKDGKPMYQTTLHVSGDGKVLTETGSAAGVNERVKIVYDRQ